MMRDRFRGWFFGVPCVMALCACGTGGDVAGDAGAPDTSLRSTAPVAVTGAPPPAFPERCTGNKGGADDGPFLDCACQRLAPDGSPWLMTREIQGDAVFHRWIDEVGGCHWGLDRYLERLNRRLRPGYRKLLRAATRDQLRQLTRHQSPRVRLAASEALAQNYPDDLDAVVPLFEDSSLVVIWSPRGMASVATLLRRSLCSLPQSKAEDLLLRLAATSKDDQDRFAMLRCVRRRRPMAAAEVARSYLRTAVGTSWVDEAIRTLALAGIDSFLEDLEPWSVHEDFRARMAVARALGASKSVASIPVLRKLSQDPDRDVRVAAALGLVLRGSVAASSLAGLFQEPKTARSAALSLAWSPIPAPVPWVDRYWRLHPDDKELVQTVADGLPTSTALTAIRSVVPSLKDEALLEAAMRFLRDARDPASAPVFAAFLTPQILQSVGWLGAQTAALQGLGMLGSAALPYLPILERAVGEGSNPVHFAALEALLELRAIQSLPALRKLAESSPADSYVGEIVAEIADLEKDAKPGASTVAPVP